MSTLSCRCCINALNSMALEEQRCFSFFRNYCSCLYTPQLPFHTNSTPPTHTQTCMHVTTTRAAFRFYNGERGRRESEVEDVCVCVCVCWFTSECNMIPQHICTHPHLKTRTHLLLRAHTPGSNARAHASFLFVFRCLCSSAA